LAEEQNFSARTIHRVKYKLGIISFFKNEDDGKKCWYWKIKQDEGNGLFDIESLENKSKIVI
jgi:hypothetical protein